MGRVGALEKSFDTCLGEGAQKRFLRQVTEGCGSVLWVEPEQDAGSASEMNERRHHSGVQVKIKAPDKSSCPPESTRVSMPPLYPLFDSGTGRSDMHESP